MPEQDETAPRRRRSVVHEAMGANGVDEEMARVVGRFLLRQVGASGRNGLVFGAIVWAAQSGIGPLRPVLGDPQVGARVEVVERQIAEALQRLDAHLVEVKPLTREFTDYKAASTAELAAIKAALVRIEGRLDERWGRTR